MDIEEQTPIGASPGIRLALVDSCIMVEHKFLETDIYQPDNQRIAFPRNEWVNLTWEITLSTKDDGAIRLYQNGHHRRYQHENPADRFIVFPAGNKRYV
jgi:hypothetical protein